MATSRFFVTNLHSKTNEKDLRQIFQEYGEVTRVELKTKENLVDPQNVKIIAFVTLNINESDAQYCANELSWQKLHGTKLKVSIAKESFLDRLKREREEANTATANTTPAKSTAEIDNEWLTKSASNTRKTFSEDFELNDDDIAPELLITKKRAATSLHNGKIVIQSFDTTPIHVIDNNKKTKHLDAKSSAADEKRKKSLNKMKNQYKHNKSTIQQSLAGLDVTGAKKIKFSDAEDDVAEEEGTTISAQKTNIFDTDDENEEESNVGIDLKSQYFGKKGEQLFKLQSGQSLDPRFKIDAKFVDHEEDEENDSVSEGQQNNYDTTNERSWQMGILEQVVGHKIDTTQKSGSSNTKNKKMLRFDPSKNEHKKLLRTKDNEIDSTQLDTKLKSKNLTTNKDVEPETVEVSKEVFYTVSDSLTQSLKTRGDGFSLLNMFGSVGTHNEEQREDNLKKVSNEKILLNKLDKNLPNPFSYDSSTDEEDNEILNKDNEGVKQKQQNQTKSGKQKAKVKIVMETFFIPKNDARLKEGAKFFKYDKEQETQEDYEEVRNRLKMLIKTKISKNKKQLYGGKRKGRNKI